MQVKFLVVGGERDGTEIPVPGPKFLIGRDADCHLRPRSEMVSRHHCVVIVDSGYVGLRDFSSKNGTFVNGEQIHGEKELKQGDEVEIGNLHFKVQVDHSLGGPKKPPVKDMDDVLARTVSQADSQDSIDEWLFDEEGEQGETVAAEAEKTMLGSDQSMSDTAEYRLQDEKLLDSAGPETTTPAETPGKEAVPKTKDTRDAALDVLRKLRKRQLEKQLQKAQLEQEPVPEQQAGKEPKK